MDNKKEKLIIIFVDVVMLLIVVAACYLMIKNPDSSWKNVYSVVIILAIPTIFYVTGSKVVADKYQFEDIIGQEDEEQEITEERNDSEKGNSI